MRSTRFIAPVLGSTFGLLALTGCQVSSAENWSLPGTVGTGSDALIVTAEMPDVGTLTKNAQVKVNDLVVGTVTDLKVRNWHAEVTLSLEPGTQLPRDPKASIGVNSLLGSSYVELASATGEEGTQTASAETRIPLERGYAYPSTEQVLTSASVVLNGGGLEQLETISREMNRALAGDGQAFADLLPRLESFATAINEQQGDIRATIRALDGAAGRYADDRETITDALDELGPGLKALSKERPELTQALESLTDLRRAAVPLLDGIEPSLVAVLKDLEPVLRALSSAGPSLVRALGYLLTFPFSPDTIPNSCQGDYCNLFATIDLTNQTLLDGFVTGGPGLPGLGPLGNALQAPGAATTAQAKANAPVVTSPNQLSQTVRDLLGDVGGLNGSDPAPKPTKPSPDSPASGGLVGGLLDVLGGER